MSGRLRSLGVGLALAGALGGAIIAACYEIPKPACGFLCGPGGACPDGYSCAGDMYCHRNDTPPDLVCTRPDAALPVDATSADAPVRGADAAPDAAIDAAPDAAIDAAPDAAIDAAADAAAADAAAADAAAADAGDDDAAIDAPGDAAPSSIPNRPSMFSPRRDRQASTLDSPWATASRMGSGQRP